MTLKSGNLSLSTVIKLLERLGCKCIRKDKGHFKFSRKDLLRPIVLQTHIDPVPQFIVKQIMRTLKISNDQMEDLLKSL